MDYHKFNGSIKLVFDTQEFKNNFKKREFVVVSDDEYPQDIKFEFADENGINALDNFTEGEAVTIIFKLMGNEYQGKYYTSNRAIAIAGLVTETVDGKTEKKTKTKSAVFNNAPSDDDLPF